MISTAETIDGMAHALGTNCSDTTRAQFIGTVLEEARNEGMILSDLASLLDAALTWRDIKLTGHPFVKVSRKIVMKHITDFAIKSGNRSGSEEASKKIYDALNVVIDDMDKLFVCVELAATRIQYEGWALDNKRPTSGEQSSRVSGAGSEQGAE